MIQFVRNPAHPTWLEVHEDGRVIQEVEVLFRLRKIPRNFAHLDEALEWLRATERRLTKWHAQRLLTLRSYPSTVLADKLHQKGFSRGLCTEVVEQLKSFGLLHDALWEEREIERELRAGHGPRLIEAKWRAKGLGVQRVRELLTDAMQRERVRELWPKLLRQKKSSQKVMAALARRGFDLDAIMAVRGIS